MKTKKKERKKIAWVKFVGSKKRVEVFSRKSSKNH